MTEVLIVLILASVALAIPGLFLVLRNMAMVADALSHTVILGIVLAFFLTYDLSSPLLTIGAALFGFLTVYGIETLISKWRIKSDAATGIVFPLFFSIGVILISKYASKAHLDVDCVLMGEVIFTPFNRLQIFGLDIPVAVAQMTVILLINLLFALLFYKELKLACLDPESAILMGFSVTALQYALTALVSLSAVTAFDSLGAVLVVAFLVIPGASALLISKRLHMALILTLAYATFNAVTGYFLALALNVSMSGMCATMAGVTYFVTYLLNPDGMITRLYRRHQNRLRFQREMLLLHIENHRLQVDARTELGVDTLSKHLKWPAKKTEYHTRKLLQLKQIFVVRGRYDLTAVGEAEVERICRDYGILYAPRCAVPQAGEK